MNFNIIKEFSIQQKSSWRLFHWIFLYSLIPAIGMFVRVFIVANKMEANVNTYAQWDYVNIMLEVVQETMILPLFGGFGKIIVSKNEDLNKVREVYLFSFIIYLVLITILTFFIGDFIKLISGSEYDQKTFFTLQLGSKIPSILTSISIVVLLNSKMYKGFLFLLIIKLISIVTFDFTLTNQNVFSNNYIGLGLSTFLTELLVFAASLILVAYNFGFKRFFNLKTFHLNIKKGNFSKLFYYNVGAAFLFSAVSNSFYLFMMARNMNIAENSDAYWIANGIIWNGILMISTVMISMQKTIVSTAGSLTSKQRIFIISEFQIISVFVLLLSYAIFIPLYYPMVSVTVSDKDLIDRSGNLFLILIGFFIFYVSSQSLNAQFNAEGKNWLMAIQAVIVNLITFIPFIILKSIGAIEMTVDVLACMFGISLMNSGLISIIFMGGYIGHTRKK